ncbi:MAG: alpha-L-fucosidase [Marinifilaceae bacterium]
MRIVFALALLILCGGVQAQKKQYYTKHVTFPANATLEEKTDMAARLVPTRQQLEWQKLELTAFIHFGVNTFTGREWGDGTESPTQFNPSAMDAEQWVRTLKESGFNLVILTAKHHDGFCLWPTNTTNYSVASSPWKEGKGDVVRELREACDKYDMKFGVYLSPWDRNAESYGDSPRYNQFFVDQLTELLTNYGEVHEVWFDGACGEGPNGKKQEYDWDRFYKTIQTLQPNAVMAIMGDDVRWVGNERGLGRETEWSATVLTPGIYGRADKQNGQLKVRPNSPDLGSRAMLDKATELFWYPSEVDVSIRPGWFYHANEDSKVKSLQHLMDIYYQSVGYNSVLLLNIPPDKRGLIHETDAQRLKEFATYRDNMLAKNFVTNGNKTHKVKQGATREYKLKPQSTINVVLLQEDITKGQRVEQFEVEALTQKGWEKVAQGTTIGYKRMVRFPDTQAKALRVRIGQSRLEANICNVAAYYAAPIAMHTSTTNTAQNQARKQWKQLSNSPLIVDMVTSQTFGSFTYAPKGEQAKPDMAYKFTFYISENGTNWTEVKTHGEFSNIMHNPQPQTVTFNAPVKARYFKIEATSPNATKAVMEMNEITIK